jgi:hypothetical protein
VLFRQRFAVNSGRFSNGTHFANCWSRAAHPNWLAAAFSTCESRREVPMAGVISVTIEQLRVAKRIEQSCGYLELSMPAQALANLDGLATEGQLEGALQYIRGQALRMQDKFDDAVEPLSIAARLLPEPAAKHVLLAVAQCQQALHRDHAVVANTMGLIRGAQLPAEPVEPGEAAE